MTKNSPSEPVEKSGSVTDLLKNPKDAPKHSAHQTDADPTHKATEFDGDPNPQGADKGKLGPQDDTPAFLERREKKS